MSNLLLYDSLSTVFRTFLTSSPTSFLLRRTFITTGYTYSSVSLYTLDSYRSFPSVSNRDNILCLVSL